MGDYHEYEDGNTGITCIIDLYNNSIGRSLGEKYKDKTDEEILDIIIENKDLFLYGEPKEDGTWVGNENYQEVEKYLNNNNNNNNNNLGEK
ncbi:MAG: hypothetical protein N4A38_00515 [Candidatus Gracilibacteria bacterium]|nr:hypothetical protein [Candidatus Gracilibacteria bacterium]